MHDGSAPLTFSDFESQFLDEIRGREAHPLLVDLGCGQAELSAGFIGADFKVKRPNVLRVDLFDPPWPWSDATVDAFTSSHFVEHVPDWDVHFSEVYRCLKIGGYYRFIAPYGKSDRFLQDPTHRQPVTENKLAYLQQEWLRANHIEHDHAPVNFSLVGLGYAYNQDYAGVDGARLDYARRRYWNVVDDIYVLIRKEAMPE